MSIHINNNGIKEISEVFVNVGGIAKVVSNGFCNIDNNSKEFFAIGSVGNIIFENGTFNCDWISKNYNSISGATLNYPTVSNNMINIPTTYNINIDTMNIAIFGIDISKFETIKNFNIRIKSLLTTSEVSVAIEATNSNNIFSSVKKISEKMSVVNDKIMTIDLSTISKPNFIYVFIEFITGSTGIKSNTILIDKVWVE